jgi:hypothetical protein
VAGTKGDSAEAVAFDLMVTIARAEGIDLDKEKAGWSKERILATYRECLAAVKSGTPSVAPIRQAS